jgi:hypothetical protein
MMALEEIMAMEKMKTLGNQEQTSLAGKRLCHMFVPVSAF